MNFRQVSCEAYVSEIQIFIVKQISYLLRDKSPRLARSNEPKLSFNRPMRFCFHHLELIVDSKKIKASSVFSLLASRPTRTTNKQKLC